ncbi:MAG: LysM peptidoglycan-binding domain-containing protein, partial [Anaerolineae bacterium]|nr:LysM peptidoglycan-binding domain-containing protein [Anaerolineae bacterium]
MKNKWLSIALVITMLMLLIGVVPASAAPSESCPVHVVQRGETLYSIARRYGVDMWTIARANGITNPNRIYVGQRLAIPTGRPVGTVHVVQPGETLL